MLNPFNSRVRVQAAKTLDIIISRIFQYASNTLSSQDTAQTNLVKCLFERYGAELSEAEDSLLPDKINLLAYCYASRIELSKLTPRVARYNNRVALFDYK